MKRYNKISIPAQGDYKKFVSIGPVMVLTEEELLDLMQESIEHSNITLLREKAIHLLHSKLKV